MRTLIVSDLHLGSLTRTDVLRRRELREPLLAALEDVDRVVLLGDVLELRHGPVRDALASSRGFFEDLGAVMSGGEIVITAGNHDHGLVEPWLIARGQELEPPPLGPEQLLEAAAASPALETVAGWCAPARVTVAYPGLWVREDVYATHGHYLDCHLTIPTLERLTMGAMERLLGKTPSSLHTAADYESICAPMFAWRDAVARGERTGAALNGIATVSAWRALRGETAAEGASQAGRGARARYGERARGHVRRLRTRALVAGFPLAVAALNRAGLGPLRSDISGEELRRAGLEAMGEVADRLGLGQPYVVFGHTHRTGPLAGDAEAEWRSPGGARLLNAGSWVYVSVFVSDAPAENPYWPGGCVVVDDDGPPRVRRLLQGFTRAQIAPPKRRRPRGSSSSPAPAPS
ncbi:MAG TPA: metallophosphoesterase [Solirubrobacteraceae bacterium]|nr:metallophosphoesterase [Solirubrobacteraceae bacterium]